MGSTMDQFNHIAIEALSLPARQRGDLAARLIRSLDQEDCGDDAANLAIVKERLKRYEAGEVESRPVKEVIHEMREKYGL